MQRAASFASAVSGRRLRGARLTRVTCHFLVERTDEFTDTGPASLLGESLGYVGISNLPYNDEGWRLNTLVLGPEV